MQSDIIGNNFDAASQILHPGSRQLFRYWEALREERACPSKAELDLKSVRKVVPNLFIWERDTSSNSFRYRLAGTAIAELLHHDPTGWDAMHKWDNFERAIMMRSFDLAMVKYQPALVRMRLITNKRDVIGCELIVLPVLGRNADDVQLLGGLFSFVDPTRLDHVSIIQQELVSVRNIWTEHEPGDALLRTIERQGVPLLRVIEGGLSKC
jgi:hypothetical protein